MSVDRGIKVCLWLFGVAALLQGIKGDNVSSAVWACGYVLLLILRELIDVRRCSEEGRQ